MSVCQDNQIKTAELEFINAALLRGDSGVWHRARPRMAGLDQIMSWWREYFENRGTPGYPERLRIYTHFPFCQQVCAFCRYWRRKLTTPAQTEQVTDHLTYLLEHFYQEFGQVNGSAAYMGGGTPSLMSTGQLERFFSGFNKAFQVSHEFTMEAHAKFLDQDKLRVIAQGGINRVSMGIQSMDPEVLKKIHRIPTELDHLADCIKTGQDLGILMNVDLVFGLPGQSKESFLKDVDTMLSLGTGLLHTYRYLPVTDLPGRITAPEFAMKDIHAIIEEKANQLTYRVEPPGDDQVGCISTRRTDELGRAKGMTNEAEQYSFFDDTRANLLSLGTGSIGHVHGKAWYRNVTSLDRQSEKGAIFVASSLTKEDEWRTALLRAVFTRDPFTFKQLFDRTGFDGLAELPEIKKYLETHKIFDGYKDNLEDSACLNADLSPELVSDLQELLLPKVGDIPGSSQLTKIPGEGIRRMAQKDLLPRGTLYPKELAQLTKLWLRTMGVKSLSSTIFGAAIANIEGSLIELAVEPNPSPRLSITITDPGIGKHMYRSKRFALSLMGRSLSDLTDKEVDVLNKLMLKMK
jgi:coproporphyrinogen III oxidase-like Fe-S oxidoreductase